MSEGRLSPFPDRFGGSQDEDPCGTAQERPDAGEAPTDDQAPPRQQTLRLHGTHAPQANPAARAGPFPPDPAPIDLRPFADQLMAIARQLREGRFTPHPATTDAALESEWCPAPCAVPAPIPTPDQEQQRRRNGVLARKAYAARRRRGAIFGNHDLFGEPAWDILLDLYIAHVERKDVSVSSACIGSASPPTTGLRWLGVLAEQGFVLREHDPFDQRRVLVRLTRRGLEAMDRYFAIAAGTL
jgi:hypothetical protein